MENLSDNLFRFALPYMQITLAYAKALAPAFLLFCFILLAFKMWTNKNQDLDLIRNIMMPLMLVLCLFSYDILIINLNKFLDIIFGALPPVDLSLARLWDLYTEGFSADWNDFKKSKGFLDFLSGLAGNISRALSVGTLGGAKLAVFLMSFAQSLVVSVQTFFKTILVLVGPWALLFSIIPAWRKVISSWFHYFFWFSLWSLSIFVVDVLVICSLQAMILDAPAETAGAGTAISAKHYAKGKKMMAKYKKVSESTQKTTKAIKEVTKLKKIVRIGKKVGSGLKKGSIGMISSMLVPLLMLFLYLMVPFITKLFFKSSGMETVMSAGMAFVTNKVMAMQRLSSKAGSARGKAGQNKQSITENLRGRAAAFSEKRQAKRNIKHIKGLDSQIQKIRSKALSEM